MPDLVALLEEIRATASAARKAEEAGLRLAAADLRERVEDLRDRLQWEAEAARVERAGRQTEPT